MRCCSICSTSKGIEMFSWKNKSQGRRNTRCKECQNIYAKEHYLRNKQYYKEKGGRARRKIVRSNKIFILNYLRANTCVDCTETDIRCLQFDHIRGKNTDIGKLECSSLDKLKAEIALCVLSLFGLR